MINVVKVKKHHDRFLRANEDMVQQQLTLGGRFAVQYAEQFPRFTPRSANGLASANEFKVVRTRGGKLLKLRNRKRHARWIEDGTRPHDIRWHGRKLLTFFWPKIGSWVRTKRVKHPGTRPYKFLHGAYMAMSRRTVSSMQSHMRLIARRF